MRTFTLTLLLTVISPGWCSWPVGPSFVHAPVNVTVSEGSHAFLPCRVANLGDRSVTWLRRRRLHIITAGLLTYSPDDRYRVLHPPDTDEWTLHIKRTRPGDAGWYECQVNSDPKITTPVLLVVRDKSLDDPFHMPEVESESNSTQVRIEGAGERYIQQGSILAVTCTADHPGGRGPQAVVWYRGAARLDYDAPRGGIALQTEKNPTTTVSRLRLSAVTPRDSGRYTCRPDTGGFASVLVHVQSDQPRAAVQQSGHNTASSHTTPLLLLLLLLATSLTCLLPSFSLDDCW
ncbi:basement membrane-specific heparan sulfate proteoglycan core protein-like [Portunus trituberculatus]|uniref:basement membrane-specific heparan sulfate proteoglycan core protein-like n=1 Tax=Portunus trituberculatus TaxID=210409 RepID=UPI001E1CB9C2|nr:basement membrane-specific heparan sulfate proteoglycan core protein-like [Portunus trituberculatus]